MRVAILGGSGFIGTALARVLAEREHSVLIPSRSPDKGRGLLPGVRRVAWDGRDAERLAEILQGMDAVVNLLGENLAAGRWTEARKKNIVQSRVQAGRAVTQAFKSLHTPPGCLVQGSAVGYYGAWRDSAQAPLCTESSPAGSGFLAETVVLWEASSQEVDTLGVRRCVIRTAPVLGAGGGMLDKIAPLYHFFLGGPVGSGRQPFAWIHLDDEVAAILYLLEHADARGVFNLSAPRQDTMNDFARALGGALSRPSWLRAPGLFVRLALGEMAEELLLSGQKVSPERLLHGGFQFKYPELGAALKAVFAQP